MDELRDTQYNLPIGTDCISRQAALVAVKDALMAWSYMPEWRDGKILEAIAELPSAEPILDARDTQYNLPIGTDCISRQAAIDALFDWEMTYDWDDHCREEDPKPEYIVSPSDVIKKLPSAQPEIIRCKDCKHWIPYDWMFSEMWQSRNMADYPEDEIGCDCCDMAMKANDFCSRAVRREVTT